MDNRGFKGIWIPRDVWLSEDLTMMEKVLLAEIDSLDNERGCYASNAYFADFFGVSKRWITEKISELRDKGYISLVMIPDLNDVQNSQRVLRVVWDKWQKEDTPLEEKFYPPTNKTSTPPRRKVLPNNKGYNKDYNSKEKTSDEVEGNAFTRRRKPISKDKLLASPHYDTANALSEFMVDCMEKNGTLTKKPRLIYWTNVFEKMLRINKLPEEQIRSLILFGTTDSFWQSIIINPQKLREKSQQLSIRMKNQRPADKQNTGTAYNCRWCKNTGLRANGEVCDCIHGKKVSEQNGTDNR